MGTAIFNKLIKWGVSENFLRFGAGTSPSIRSLTEENGDNLFKCRVCKGLYLDPETEGARPYFSNNDLDAFEERACSARCLTISQE